MLAALPARAEPDETGFFGIRLGTPLEDVLATQPTAHIWQETKTELAGCYFQYSIPTILGDAEAEAWLCEARDHPDKLVMEISVEATVEQGKLSETGRGADRTLRAPHALLGSMPERRGGPDRAIFLVSEIEHGAAAQPRRNRELARAPYRPGGPDS